ncbi:MAG: FAD-binding oxidoreductase [Bryobacteraceae bacterium]|jgi:glycolate oxidase FAD binding subunit
MEPETAEELAELLRRPALHSRTIALEGNGSKRLMAGPNPPSDECFSTGKLNRVREYEPRDLTIGVEAGLRWSELTRLVGKHRQMVPLDPPFADCATVGGVVATNTSGPRRRLYGTARDAIIGMEFATLEGKLVRSGGMVVKNVAGLDMAKLMIGSFGTLAAITAVNFKLTPMPELERSFLVAFDSLASAIEARNSLLRSQLQPAAIDLLNPAAGAGLGQAAWLVAIRVGGNAAAIDRYEREISQLGGGGVAFDNSRQETLWRRIEEFTPAFLAVHPDGAVARASCTLKGLEAVMASLPGAGVARAGSGICYGYFERAADAAAWVAGAAEAGAKAVVEFAPEEAKSGLDLWPAPGADWEIMRRVKHLFDPDNLLNRGRLYRRL